VLAPFNDAKRALQTIRYHAQDWDLDASDIALAGESAGACSALWLALSPDLADPNSSDPIDKLSTRVVAVGVKGAQTTLDPLQAQEWNPETFYGARAFGLWDASKANFDAYLQRRSDFEKYFATLSPAALLGPDNPPMYLSYGSPLDLPPTNDHVHAPEWGVGFQKLAQEKGAPVCLLQYKDHPAEGYENRDLYDFVIHYLKASKGSAGGNP
jgi:acetyl esterase/lipase